MRQRSLLALGFTGLLTAFYVGCNNVGTTNPPTDGPTTPTSPTTPTTGPSVHEPVISKELMITDLAVVNDARTTGDGVWTFGHLMKEMAGNADVSKFMVNWLTSWEQEQTVNTFKIPVRNAIRQVVIDPWKKRDGFEGRPDDQWQVKLENAPMRLLAIVNRVDLNRQLGQRAHSGGEGRFVFGVVDARNQTNPTAMAPLPFTVIFEYQLRTDVPDGPDAAAKSREKLRGWAQQWHKLGEHAQFDDRYKQDLQVITDRFTKMKSEPNAAKKARLNQLRTNEIALVLGTNPGLGWELREFNLENDALKPVTVKQTPAAEHNGTPLLAQFVNNHLVELIEKDILLPEKLDNNGPNFLAASAIIAPDPGPGAAPSSMFKWDAPGIAQPQARHGLGFLTCNGCHRAETNLGNFTHIANRPAGQQAELSSFLTGATPAPDPVTGVSRTFNDLAERAAILKIIAGEPGAIVLQELLNKRVGRVH